MRGVGFWQSGNLQYTDVASGGGGGGGGSGATSQTREMWDAITAFTAPKGAAAHIVVGGGGHE